MLMACETVDRAPIELNLLLRLRSLLSSLGGERIGVNLMDEGWVERERERGERHA